MNQRLFFNGEEIDYIERTFDFNGRLRAEIVINGEHLIVFRDTLKEESELTLIEKVNVTSNKVEILSKKFETLSESFRMSEVVKTNEQPVEVTLDTNILVQDETSEPITKEVKEEVKEETEPETKEEVVAKRLSNNRKTKLGVVGSEKFNNFVKQNKLDINAINNVLDGKNKTHKGFEFSYQ